MMCQKLPEQEGKLVHFDIKRLNKFIENQAYDVLTYFNKVINIDITEVDPEVIKAPEDFDLKPLDMQQKSTNINR